MSTSHVRVEVDGIRGRPLTELPGTTKQVQSCKRTQLEAISRHLGCDGDEKGACLFHFTKEVKGQNGRRENGGHAKVGCCAGDIMWRPSLGPVVRDLEKREPVSALCS